MCQGMKLWHLRGCGNTVLIVTRLSAFSVTTSSHWYTRLPFVYYLFICIFSHKMYIKIQEGLKCSGQTYGHCTCHLPEVGGQIQKSDYQINWICIF